MKELIDYKSNEGIDYVMLTLHSSELIPGGIPTFKKKKLEISIYN